MKKALSFLACIFLLAVSSCKISNPKAEDCHIQTETIIKISKSTTNDIVFSDNHGDHYYINRGIENGLNLDSLKAKVLNKSVTLHLPKLAGGIVTSEHIAQLAIGDDIIFTEFN